MNPKRQGVVDTYLDQLFDRLAGSGAAGRRLLAEAEDHLQEAVDEALARGLDADTAQREAVARFGSIQRLAAMMPPSPTQCRWAARRFAVGGWLLAAVTLLAFGLSGLLTWALGWPYIRLLITNNSFGAIHAYYTDQQGVETPMEICTWHRPLGGPCVEVSHGNLEYLSGGYGSLNVTHFLFAVLLGLCHLAVLVLARRYTRLGLAAWTPPRTVPATAFAASAGVAAAFLTFIGVMGVINGLQAWALSYLVTGVVCAVTATLSWRLRRSTRPRIG